MGIARIIKEVSQTIVPVGRIAPTTIKLVAEDTKIIFDKGVNILHSGHYQKLKAVYKLLAFDNTSFCVKDMPQGSTHHFDMYEVQSLMAAREYGAKVKINDALLSYLASSYKGQRDELLDHILDQCKNMENTLIVFLLPFTLLPSERINRITKQLVELSQNRGNAYILLEHSTVVSNLTPNADVRIESL